MHLSACCKWTRRFKLIDENPFDGLAGKAKLKKAGNAEEEVHPFSRKKRDRLSLLLSAIATTSTIHH
ncbi:MAG: hypothetical protein WA949_00860 [Phormidesmis sp.]